MDADRFDSVARAFCHTPSRRTMMGALLAGAVAPIEAVLAALRGVVVL